MIPCFDTKYYNLKIKALEILRKIESLRMVCSKPCAVLDNNENLRTLLKIATFYKPIYKNSAYCQKTKTY